MPDYQNYNARKLGEYGDIWTNTGKCVFCDLKDKYIIAKNATAVLTVNLFPYIDGHLLVIPIRHVEDFLEITPTEWVDMRNLSEIGIKLLRKKLNLEEILLLLRVPNGFKAQKTVAHCHMHIIPQENKVLRWRCQDITIPPIDFAKRLRSLELVRNLRD